MKITLKFLIVLFSLTISLQLSTFGQNSSISQVLDIKLKNSGTITENGEVTGYYFFYMVDKVNRKNREFIIQIMDANLQELTKKSIVESKHVQLLEGAFNGQNLMFSFYNPKDRLLIMRQFDLNMKEISMNTFEQDINDLKATVGSEASFITEGNKDLNLGKTLFPVQGNGFIQVLGGHKATKSWIKLQYISSNDPGSNWEKSFRPEKGREINRVMKVTGNFLFMYSQKMTKSSGSITIDSYLAVTGTQLWSHSMQNSQGFFSPFNVFFNEGNQEVLIGGIFYEKSKGGSLPDGIFINRLDVNGTEKSATISKWTEMDKFLAINKSGKVDKEGFLHPQSFQQTADGKYIMITESYKKKLSAGATALTMLGGTVSAKGTVGYVSPAKLHKNSFIVFEYDKNMILEDVMVLDKPKSTSYMLLGMEMMPMGVLGLYAELFDMFDYQFTITQADQKRHSVIFTGRDEEKKGDYIVGTYTYDNGVYSQDKITINKKADAVRLVPAKPGFLLFMEYFRKSKTVNLKLAKINF